MANSAAVASDQDEEDFVGLSLDGLAGLWNGDETIRSIVLHSGVLTSMAGSKKNGGHQLRNYGPECRCSGASHSDLVSTSPRTQNHLDWSCQRTGVVDTKMFEVLIYSSYTILHRVFPRK